MNSLFDEIRLRYASDPISKMYRKCVYDDFKIGKSYTNNEILEDLQKIAERIDDKKHIPSTNKAVNVLRKFFEVEASTRGSGKNSKRFYRIIGRK